MKTVKELLEVYNDNYLSKSDPRFGKKYPPEKDIPNVLNLRRKAIRVFPDGQKIALYYSPQLDRYVSIPYGPGTQASGIQISEWVDFTPDARDPDDKELRAAYRKMQYMSGASTAKKNVTVNRKQMINQLSMPTVRKASLKAAAGKALSNAKGDRPSYVIGQLLGLGAIGAAKGIAKGARAAVGAVKKMLPEDMTPSERFKKHLQEERSGVGKFLDDYMPLYKSNRLNLEKKSKESLSQNLKDYATQDVPKALMAIGPGRAAVAAKMGVGAPTAVSKGKIGSILSKLKGKVGKGLRFVGRGLKGAAAVGGAIAAAIGGADGAVSAAKDRAKETTRFKEPEFGHINPKLGGGATSSQDILGQQQSLGIGRKFTAQKIQEKKDDEPVFHYAKRKAKEKTRFKDQQFPSAAAKMSGGAMSPQDVYQSQLGLGIGRKFKATKDMQEQSNYLKIKTIVENNLQFDNIAFNETEIKINNRIAKKVINLYESLNKDNKKKIEAMLDEDVNSFKKIINFAIRQ